MWKEPAAASFKVLLQNLPGKNEENHETPQSPYQASGNNYQTITVSNNIQLSIQINLGV
jgi:hypothetical protein